MHSLETSIGIDDAREAVREIHRRGGDFRIISQDIIHSCNGYIDSILTSHRLHLIEPNFSEFAEDQSDDAEDVTDCGLLIQNPRKLRPTERVVYEEVNRLARDIVHERNAIWKAMHVAIPWWRTLCRWNPELTDDEWWDINLQLAGSVRSAADWRRRTNHVLYDNLLSLEEEQTDALKRWLSEGRATLTSVRRAMRRIVTGHSLEIVT